MNVTAICCVSSVTSHNFIMKIMYFNVKLHHDTEISICGSCKNTIDSKCTVTLEQCTACSC